MKILKQLAVAAVASAVLLTGCQNSFTGTTRDLSVLGEINRSAGTTVLSVTSVAPVSSMVNTTNQQLKITFSEPVDTATLATAVFVYPVTSATTNPATSLWVRGSAVPATFLYSSGSDVVLQLDLSSLTTDRLEVYIDSTKLTARNGAVKLDLDNDKVQGEVGDDDYYYVSPNTALVGQASTVGTFVPKAIVATTTGVARNPRVTFSFTGNPAFGKTNGTDPVYTNLTVTYSNSYDTGTDTYDYKSIFDAAIVIEKYVPAANAIGSWTPVTKGTSTYATATGLYTVPFSGVVDGDVIRARVINLSTLVTNGEFNGFKQKFVHKSGFEKLSEFVVTSSVKEVTTSTAADQLRVSTTDQQNGITPSAIFDTNNLNGKIKLVISTSVLGDKGINTATVIPANIKIVDATGNTINWTSATVISPAAPATIPTVIYLNLDPAYQKQNVTYNLYFTSGLKTLTGSTLPATLPNANARSFGDVLNIETLPALIGTYKHTTSVTL